MGLLSLCSKPFGGARRANRVHHVYVNSVVYCFSVALEGNLCDKCACGTSWGMWMTYFRGSGVDGGSAEKGFPFGSGFGFF